MARGSKRGRGKSPRTPKRVPRDLSQPIDKLEWEVEAEDDGQRLDRFLHDRLPWRSRSSIVELLTEGRVQRNAEVARKKATRLREGDRVEVAVPPPDEEVRHEELAHELEGAILYEDSDLLALDKPAGLVVHPVGRIRANTLIQGLHWMFRHGSRKDEQVLGGELEGVVGPATPRICHRLDRETSGVLVVAKTIQTRSALQKTFEDRLTGKEYLALVHGVLTGESGLIDAPLGPDPRAEIDLMMTVRPDGAPSRTSWRVEERFDDATLVRFVLHTGRQHQIRVHAARVLRAPVLCDLLYGAGERAWPAQEPTLQRQALHAQRLVLTHPCSGEELVLEAPLPTDLVWTLEVLRGTNPRRTATAGFL